MSEFFKALEQAERDRALGRSRRRAEAEPEAADDAALEPAVEAGADTTSVVDDEPGVPSFFRPPLTSPARQRAARPESSDGVSPGIDGGIDGHMVSLLTPTSFEAEQYRTLRHTIEQLHASAGLSIIACTSPTGGDGKTITAINLAGALAQGTDTRVLLVDADLRRPCIARELMLGDDAGPGLVGAIVNRELTLESVVRVRPPFALSILPAGAKVGNPYELLKSPRLVELMDQARQRYDYVVLDTPPAVTIPDCRAIARCVDGFVIVVAAHRTPRKMLEEALNSMEPAKVIGLIFNADDRPLTGYYYGGHHNGASGEARAGQWVKQAGRSVRVGLGRLRPRRSPDR